MQNGVGDMILEARSPNCFSRVYVLKMQGRPIGEFEGRWFSEGMDIRLIKRRRLHLEKTSMFGSQFTLTDQCGAVLSSAHRSGFFTSAWDLQLSEGYAQLVSAGLFNTGFQVVRNQRIIAEAGRIGFCEGGWFVKSFDSISHSDMILVGLIYHTILQRRSRQNSS